METTYHFVSAITKVIALPPPKIIQLVGKVRAGLKLT